MESDSKLSTINDPSIDVGKKQKEPLDNCSYQSTLVRPTMLSSATNTGDIFRYPNIANINMNLSPLDTRPRLFQPGSLIDSKTYEQILSNVYAPPDIKRIEEDNDDDGDDDRNNVIDERLFNENVHNHQYEQEIQQLTQLIRTNQPTDDNVANIIMQQLNDILETTTINYDNNDNQVAQNEFETSSIISTAQHPYPPVNQTGPVKDHDRPYADYGHLNRQTIAEECQFNLQPPSSSSSCNQQQQQSIRLQAKSFAITSWTNVSKDSVMNEIKREFGIENIQYICIGEEISELNHQRHLHIQIIFKEKVDRRKPFLDDITRTHCNYQVTHNDLAWNEYIKKGGNCIEFNEFKSTKTRGQKQWPSQSSSSSSSTINYPTTTTTTTTAKGRTAEEKQRQKDDIARHAFHLAKTSINDALIFMRDNSIPTDFLRYSQWYKNTFTLIHLLEQYEMARTGNIIKEYTWPESFPDCTPALREVVDRWIREEFNRPSRAKCLILIGGTGTGKTTFAKSLSGQYNYFQGRWRLDSWKDSARYLIFDDIPWDKFDQLGFPPKKALLTQNGLTMATDKYKPSTEIYIRQPAIVLLNSDDTGSLLAEPITIEQQQIVNYWQHRATIYRIGPDEYFHKPDYYRDNDVNQIPNNPSMNTLTNIV